jgi:hypothetical protein
MNSQIKQHNNKGYLQKVNFFDFLRKSKRTNPACLNKFLKDEKIY